MRRLEEFDTIAFDRRGYAGSLGLGAAGSMEDHVADLRRVSDWARRTPSTSAPLVVVGHSLGGLVGLLGARVTATDTDSVPDVLCAYEAPMPWATASDGELPGNSALAVARREGPAAAAEFFYRAMVGDSVWERLGDVSRAARLAEGPALVSDLEISRVDAARPRRAEIGSAVRLACGERSSRHLRKVAAAWALDLGVDNAEIRGAGHGAHLSHPGEFADWIRSSVDASGKG